MLYLDAGNTHVKVARPTTDGWEIVSRYRHDALEGLIESLELEPASGCSVVDAIMDTLPTVRWLRRTDLPTHRLDYLTPQTLGIDRFVACHGAWQELGTAVIVVDAGTAATIDLMDAEGVFQGGVIMPGLGLIENALHTQAPALPSVPRELSSTYPPKSTVDALKAGLVESWTAGIIHHIRQLHAFSPEAQVVVTGADASVIQTLGEVRPFVLFDGLRSLSR